MKTIIVALAFQGLLILVSSHIIRDDSFPVIYQQVEYPQKFLTGPVSSALQNLTLVQESTLQVDLCNCGRSTNTKVVGGTEASEGEFPWRVLILARKANGSMMGCGATIISPRWLLTAAHCFEKNDRVLFLEPGEITPKPYNFEEAKRFVLHENYEHTNQYSINDIALVELNSDLDFSNPNIAPVCLPYQLAGQTEVVGQVVGSGWGDMAEGSKSPRPTTLRKVTLDLIGNKQCKQMHRQDVGERIESTHTCTYTPYKDICQGDSGGSIDALIDGKWHALGVVSYGHGCARHDTAGIYTRVSEFTSWIEKKTGIRSFC